MTSDPAWMDGDDTALGKDGYCEFCDMTHDDDDFHEDDGVPDRMWGDDE